MFYRVRKGALDELSLIPISEMVVALCFKKYFSLTTMLLDSAKFVASMNSVVLMVNLTTI